MSTPASIMIGPRSSRFQSAKATDWPVPFEIRTPVRRVAFEGHEGVEQPVEDRRAAGVRQQLRLVADQRAGGHDEPQARAPDARGAHLEEFALALGELLDDRAGVLVVDVDDDFLDRL